MDRGASRSDRVTENEALFRRANETLLERISELGATPERIPFICECGDRRCTEVITLTIDEYASVRAHPARFAIVAGHEEAGDEVVVDDREGFWIVEKRGAARRAIEDFERSAR